MSIISVRSIVFMIGPGLELGHNCEQSIVFRGLSTTHTVTIDKSVEPVTLRRAMNDTTESVSKNMVYKDLLPMDEWFSKVICQIDKADFCNESKKNWKSALFFKNIFPLCHQLTILQAVGYLIIIKFNQ